MDWLRRLREQLLGFYLAYLVGLVCWLATEVLRPLAPIWPLGYYTLVWVLVFFFPGMAVLYATFNLRVRINEIEDVAKRNQFHFVYFPDVQRQESERLFSKFLRQRFAAYYNLLELYAFALVAGTITFLGAFFLAVQLSIPDGPLVDLQIKAIGHPTTIPTWVLVIGSSFFGSLSGALVLLFKKYTTFDVYPATFSQAAVGLVVGTLAGAFVVTIWPATYMTFLAFATGFLTAINSNFLPRLMRQQFARLSGTNLPPELDTDLNLVLRNSEAIEGLHNMSLFSVAEFIKTESIRLYLNMPQPIGVINGWMDEALLHYYFTSRLDELRRVHIRRFSQLTELIVDQFGRREIRWRQAVVITGEDGADGEIIVAVKTIVDSRVHHRLLGILSERYREAFFLP